MKAESSDSSRYFWVHVTKQHKHECDSLGEPTLVDLGPLTGISGNLSRDEFGELQTKAVGSFLYLGGISMVEDRKRLTFGHCSKF
jgi:hypothetical protein